MRLQQLSGNIPFWETRAHSRIADRIHSPESIWELPLQFPKLQLKEHIGVTIDAEDEGHLGLVLGILEYGVRQLVHGCDTSAAGDESDVRVLVGRPFVSEQWAGFERECLAWNQGVKMIAHFAVRVALYEKIDMARLIWVTDRGVWPQHG